MNRNRFDYPTDQILSNENLQTINDSRNLIDKNLLDESQKFMAFDRQSVKVKEVKLESTDQIDIRVKKCNDLNERMKKFAKNMKKQSKQSDAHCELHQNVKPMAKIDLLEKLNEEVSPVPDLNEQLKRDETVLQQHGKNIEKLNKLIDAVTGYNYKIESLPEAETLNNSIAFLREIVNDVDYLNESVTMYTGLATKEPSHLYTKEIKVLSDHLNM